MAGYYHTRKEKVIIAAMLLGIGTLLATGGYVAGYHVGKNKEVAMASEPEPILVQTPVVTAEQPEDTVQMTPEQIKKEGITVKPGDNIAEKIGFKPKKQQKLVNVGEDPSDATGYIAPPCTTPKKKVVKVYEIVESTNGGRTW